MNNYLKLQNGSDIRGVAIDGVQGEHINLNYQVVYNISKAFVLWLSEKNKISGFNNISIAIGTDSRLSSPELLKASLEGVSSYGAKGINCSMASTPAMFMATKFEELKATGAIMITASHLPYNRNGMKFFSSEGGLDKNDIKSILEYASKIESGHLSISISNKGSIENFNLIEKYSDHLVSIIRNSVSSSRNFNKPLSGKKIIVDAGNGAGGFFADLVLKPLGADISGSIFLNPDGNFPNHSPNPEDKKAIEYIKEATIKNNADLGIIFDTDVDRAAVVAKNGEVMNRNRLIALLSAIVLKKNKNSTIVTDSVTSVGLKTFIESLGGKHHRFKRGYKNVINESIRLNNEGILSDLAIETSGHGAFKENYFLDDGAYIVTKILIEMSKLDEHENLFDLIKELDEPKESEEYRIKIINSNFKPYGENVLKDLESYVNNNSKFSIEKINYEGVRSNWKIGEFSGWFLIRLSLHDPVLPLNIESEKIGGIEKILPYLEEFLSSYTDLDISSLIE